MTRPYLDIDSQIIRIYSRGMKIDYDPKINNADFLLRKNYYNTMNVYGRFFLDLTKPPTKYIHGSCFSEIRALYYFDKELRDLSFKKLVEVEANLRSTISSFFAEVYGSSDAYTQTSSFNLLDRNGNICATKINDFTYLQREIQKIFRNNYKRNRRSRNAIDHYLRNRENVPIWILINYFTFGNLNSFYGLLSDHLQDKTANSFSESVSTSYNQTVTFSRKEMQNYMRAMKDLRNRIAHDNTLLFFNSEKNTTINSFIHSSRNMMHTPNLNTFFPTLITIQMFISKNNFIKFQNDIEELILEINSKLKSINSRLILDALGFPINWKI